MAEPTILEPEEVLNFRAKWNPKGVQAMDGAQLEGLAPAPVVTPAATAPVTEVKAEEKKPEAATTTPEATSEIKIDPAKPADTKIESSLTPEATKDASTENKTSTPVAKTLEEYLTEKSEGKYKTYEELLAQIDAPKKNSYKSQLAEKIDAYVEAGGTEENYLRTQSIDFTKMSTKELLEYKIQMSDPDMTDEEIEYELTKQYRLDEVAADDATDAEKKEIQFAKLRAEREAKKTQAELIETQKKWAVPERKAAPVVDPKVHEKEQNDWTNEIKSEVEKLVKVPVKLSETESYDIVMDEKDKKELTELGSKLFTDANAFWNQFKDKDGNIQKGSLMNAMYKIKNFDKAVQFAAAQAREKGKETLIKDELKNINMKPGDNKGPEVVKKTTADHIKDHARKVALEEAGRRI